MSDYVYKKVIRFPLTGMKDIKNYNLDDFNLSDLIDYMEENYKDEFKVNALGNKKEYFEIPVLYNNEIDINGKEIKYLDFVINEDYYTDLHEFGRSRFLLNIEKIYFYKIFSKILSNETFTMFKAKNLKLVEYCWYNCSESENYYHTLDKFYLNLIDCKTGKLKES